MRLTKLAKYLNDHGISDIEGARRIHMHVGNLTLHRTNGVYSVRLAKKLAKAFCENDYHMFLESRDDKRVILDYDI